MTTLREDQKRSMFKISKEQRKFLEDVASGTFVTSGSKQPKKNAVGGFRLCLKIFKDAVTTNEGEYDFFKVIKTDLTKFSKENITDTYISVMRSVFDDGIFFQFKEYLGGNMTEAVRTIINFCRTIITFD